MTFSRNGTTSVLHHRPAATDVFASQPIDWSVADMPYSYLMNLCQDGKENSPFWESYYFRQEPLIVRNCPLGACQSEWTIKKWLRHPPGGGEREGGRLVSVHCADEATKGHLNFRTKNFEYQMMSFHRLLSHIHDRRRSRMSSNEEAGNGDGYFYYRATGNRPFKDVARLTDFGEDIARQFSLPSCLTFPQGYEVFSSILRVSHPNVSLWPHYDIPDNFLAVIRGRKRVRLWHPSSAGFLGIFGEASSSEMVDILHESHGGRRAFVDIEMDEGDILFLPRFWIHAVEMLHSTSSRRRGLESNDDDDEDDGRLSVSVNLFFSSPLSAPLIGGKDLYGNEDPPAYKEAVRVMRCQKEKMMKSIGAIDKVALDFYLDKLAHSISCDRCTTHQ